MFEKSNENNDWRGLTYDKLSVTMSVTMRKREKMTIQIRNSLIILEDGIQNMIDAAIYDYQSVFYTHNT